MSWKDNCEFVIISPVHSHMWRFAVPVWGLVAVSVLAITFAIVGGHSLYNSWQKNAGYAKAEVLQNDYNEQQTELQQLNNQLLSLEHKMDRLGELDQKIRLMTNLQEPREDGFFGTGGSTANIHALQVIDAEKLSLTEILERNIEHLSVLATLQEDSFHNLKSHLADNKDILDRTPSIWPVKGFISSPYGPRKDPFTGEINMHQGVDIVAPAGAPIRASADGIVTVQSADPGMGLMLVIDHGYGVITRYGHNQSNLVNEGQRVSRGDVIALVGSTGRSTGPHTHYEVLISNIPIDPSQMMISKTALLNHNY